MKIEMMMDVPAGADKSRICRAHPDYKGQWISSFQGRHGEATVSQIPTEVVIGRAVSPVVLDGRRKCLRNANTASHGGCRTHR